MKCSLITIHSVYSNFCVTTLYTYIFGSLRYRNKGIEKRKQYIRAVL